MTCAQNNNNNNNNKNNNDTLMMNCTTPFKIFGKKIAYKSKKNDLFLKK